MSMCLDKWVRWMDGLMDNPKEVEEVKKREKEKESMEK